MGQRSANLALREWHTNNLGRLPGLKFMRTLWVCNVAGGPFEYTATNPGSTALGLEEAHRELRISPEEFDEVAAELGRTLDFVKVPQREKDAVLGAFAAHKGEVTDGYTTAASHVLVRRRRLRRDPRARHAGELAGIFGFAFIIFGSLIGAGFVLSGEATKAT